MTNFSTYFNIFNEFYVSEKIANFNEFYNGYERTQQLWFKCLSISAVVQWGKNEWMNDDFINVWSKTN